MNTRTFIFLVDQETFGLLASYRARHLRSRPRRNIRLLTVAPLQVGRSNRNGFGFRPEPDDADLSAALVTAKRDSLAVPAE